MASEGKFVPLPGSESPGQEAAVKHLALAFGGEPWYVGAAPARVEYRAERDSKPVHVPVAVLAVRAERDRSRPGIPLALGDYPVLTRAVRVGGAA